MVQRDRFWGKNIFTLCARVAPDSPPMSGDKCIFQPIQAIYGIFYKNLPLESVKQFFAYNEPCPEKEVSIVIGKPVLDL